HLGLDLSHYDEYESVEVIVGSVTGDVNRAMQATGVRYELFHSKDPSKSSVFALFVDADQADKVRTLLQ
ncbi:MAG: hypothetical protein GWN18_10200, partial [Thermoplasmata archaeon]|nr:hypothetical protein [Thermoplasmata archaeon]NIS12414.1 hypothetical protein [Thermoplasmata archaeon]NIS20336.1 hypothetical protein [Thermoplasmata archaeon]NIT77679.1 hypothetical protein [Thermoplasmata archaeon]NIU49424.1 hypothetical protein [Thermoplasmata archaeon]